MFDAFFMPRLSSNSAHLPISPSAWIMDAIGLCVQSLIYCLDHYDHLHHRHTSHTTQLFWAKTCAKRGCSGLVTPNYHAATICLQHDNEGLSSHASKQGLGLRFTGAITCLEHLTTMGLLTARSPLRYDLVCVKFDSIFCHSGLVVTKRVILSGVLSGLWA
ncbi:hypothetical protein GQ44DRAFT_12293 [Phaeosphaeriaceae sp. PMI808]|nr:hypothetical protein GQ44DRAFT_12293 [Phaeosphaeriaceae sp. PMI808]